MMPQRPDAFRHQVNRQCQLVVLLLALPIVHAEIETLALCDDRFLLALPSAKRLSARVRATKDLIEHERLLLLEEGHCLRDHALAACRLRARAGRETFNATSLPTLMQFVQHGYGMTMLPEMAVKWGTIPKNIEIIPFKNPK